VTGPTYLNKPEDAPQRRAPTWVLVLMLLMSGILAPLFWLGISEDRTLSETTTGRLLPGGEPGTSYEGEPYCKGSRVEFEVDGTLHGGLEPVRGVACPTGDDVEEVTVRYDPDDPDHFSSGGAQPILWGFVAASLVAFLLLLVAVLRRVGARLFSWRGELRGDS
jgi:hypothetical protein